MTKSKNGERQQSVTEGRQYRVLGSSGLRVPPLGTGTNRWTQGKNDEAVFGVFRSLLDEGVNFFDTAEIYSMGKSERLLGACLHEDGRPTMIATKFAPYPTRLSRRQFMDALDASLKRLGRPTIALYYIHFPYSLLSIEILMDFMAHAVSAGKIRAVGVSNFSADQMRRAAARLARYGIPLAANQVRYNLLHRQPERNGVLAACRELDVALVAYRPLERGRLKSYTVPGGNSSSPSQTKGQTKAASKEEAIEETLQSIAQQRGKSASQVALNWLLRRDAHVIPIPGTTNASHAMEIADTLKWQLTDDEFSAIDRVSAT